MDIFFGFFGLGLAIGLPIYIVIFLVLLLGGAAFLIVKALCLFLYVLIYNVDPKTGKPRRTFGKPS